MVNTELLEALPVLQTSNADTEQENAAFIGANTVEANLDEIKSRHIIPVFVKDNETLISHSEFVDAAVSLTADIFHGEHILNPQIRVSHPIKGRIPEAKDKPANQLNEWEKTLYYERMMFVIEIPSIWDTVDGNHLSLTIGGVKAYNLDNLYSRSLSDQHFKIFIGFKNKVCTNLCVWTDGYLGDVKVKNLDQLKACIRTLIEAYNKNYHLHNLKQLTEHSLTEQQFAHLIGRCRMYNHLPNDLKAEISPILFGDNQISSVVKDYYRDNSFCRDENGNINLWRLYNLFTGANKSTYIDNFLDRSVNAFQLAEQLRHASVNRSDCWFLN
ncbi:DUF3871 family protein [Lacibacter sp. MH-610]|uniref:DUF3871 family protein n=1 Tax=Lacibacter sp. MH-610 TaxID=3020883 RepID=UPI0038928856